MQTHGETHPAAKLDEDIVRYCRIMVRQGDATCAGLAVIFEISQSGMWMAVHGGTWNHLPNAVPYSGPWRGGGVRLRRRRRHRCGCCGDFFPCARSDARYCSGACRSLMHYLKVREWPNGHR